MFKIMLPPDPYKGVDDWIVARRKGSLDDLEELDIEAYEWWPISLLKETGLKFRPNKDGQVVSYKQAVATHSNTMIFAEQLFTFNKPVAIDKYAGYIVDGQRADAQRALGSMQRILTDSFPEFKYSETGLRHYFSEYCNAEGKSNMVAEYVEHLQWDGEKRLDSWLPKAMELGDEVNVKYAARVGQALIAAMYARITRPGCQQDFMFILVGAQGIGKSSFFRVLGNFPEYEGYSAITISQLTKLDYTMGLALKKAVILDVDDLEDMRRKDQGELKTFISRTADEWCEVYTTRIVTEPRGFVLTGSTNNHQVLTDTTGNRRYLTLEVKDIRNVKGKFAWTQMLRDQLLAECRERWAALKDTWWDIPIDDINKANTPHAVSDVVVETISDMWDNDLCADHPTHGMLITGQAIHKSMEEQDSRMSEHYIGIRLAKLSKSKTCGFEISPKFQIDSRFLADLPQQIRGLFATRAQRKVLWVRKIKKL